MNFQKDERRARRIAKEQKKLRKMADQGRLDAKGHEKLSWEIVYDNYEDAPEPQRKPREEYDEYDA